MKNSLSEFRGKFIPMICDTPVLFVSSALCMLPQGKVSSLPIPTSCVIANLDSLKTSKLSPALSTAFKRFRLPFKQATVSVT